MLRNAIGRRGDVPTTQSFAYALCFEQMIVKLTPFAFGLNDRVHFNWHASSSVRRGPGARGDVASEHVVRERARSKGRGSRLGSGRLALELLVVAPAHHRVVVTDRAPVSIAQRRLFE